MAAGRKIIDTRFNLVRWFSVAGFIAIAFLSTVFAIYFTRMLSHHVLDHDANVMSEMVNGIIRHESGLTTSLDKTSQNDARNLEKFFRPLSKTPGIIRANIYSPSHEILWSSDEVLKDHQFEENDELKETLGGKPVAHLSEGDEHSKEEHVLLAHKGQTFVEYYLPIWLSDRDKSQVVAVAEIYRVPTALLEKLDNIKLSVWVSFLLGGLFLFFSLFWIIRRAANIIELQDQQLMESQRLITIGEMVSAVAHSLRNPLSSIRSSAELARENSNSDDTNESLDHIIRETDMLEAWVRQYLAQIEDEHVSDDCSLQASIDEAISELRSHPLAQYVNFEIDLPQHALIVRFNCLLLTQIVRGLLSNALEARPIDKKVTICGRVEPDKSRIRLTINDKGNGIRRADSNRLFEPFFTTKRNGLGIGLALTRRILERHGGSIQISSDEQKGTTVMVFLPQD